MSHLPPNPPDDHVELVPAGYYLEEARDERHAAQLAQNKLIRDAADHVQLAPGPRVYVVQQSDLNLGPAARYGTLVPVLPNRVNLTGTAARELEVITSALKDFTDADYLLPLGDPVAIGLAFCAAAAANEGRVQVLKWDRVTATYYVVNCDLSRLGEN